MDNTLKTSWSVSIRGILLPFASHDAWGGHVTQFWPMRWMLIGRFLEKIFLLDKKEGTMKENKQTLLLQLSLSLLGENMIMVAVSAKCWKRGNRGFKEPISRMTSLNCYVRLEVQDFCFLRRLNKRLCLNQVEWLCTQMLPTQYGTLQRCRRRAAEFGRYRVGNLVDDFN